MNGDIPLLGPPSHVGGRHLGALYYYYVALTKVCAGGDVYVAVLLQTFLKSVALLASLVLLLALFDLHKLHWPLAFALLFMFSGSYAWPVRVPWHGNFVVLPSVFFLFCSFHVMKNGLRCIPLFLLSLSFLVQTQLASAPMLLAFSAVVALCLSSKGELRGGWHESFGAKDWLLLVCALVSWFPTIFYEFAFSSNIASLWNAHGGGQGEGAAAGTFSATMMVLTVLREYTTGVFGVDFLGQGTCRYLEILLLLTALFGLLDYLRANDGVRRAFVSALVLTVFAYIAALSFLGPPLHVYYLHSALPVILLLGSISFSHCMIRLTALYGNKSWRRPAACLVGALSLLGVSFALVNAWRHAHAFTQAFSSRVESLDHVRRVGMAIRAESTRSSRIFDIDLSSAAASVQQPLRLNAYYFFAGPDYDALMDQAGYFPELKSFNVHRLENSVLRANLICDQTMPPKLSREAYLQVDGCVLLASDGPDKR